MVSTLREVMAAEQDPHPPGMVAIPRKNIARNPNPSLLPAKREVSDASREPQPNIANYRRRYSLEAFRIPRRTLYHKDIRRLGPS